VASVKLRILNDDGSYGTLGDNTPQIVDTAKKGGCAQTWIQVQGDLPARLETSYAVEITNLGVGGDSQKAGIVRTDGLE
jgi:hypothetical protein